MLAVDNQLWGISGLMYVCVYFICICYLSSLFDMFIQARDVQEGADMIMVKPGMAYLDIVRDLKNQVRQHKYICINMHYIRIPTRSVYTER